jgi:hypothetical protein
LDKSIEIEKYLHNLNRSFNVNIPDELQQKAIDELTLIIDDENLYRLIQPIDKGYWENAAVILKRIGFPRLMVVSDGLTRWLQDLNWPGARIIFNIFCDLPNDELVPILKTAIKNAESENDTVWLYWLNELADRKNIYGLLSKEDLDILEKRDR